jgi:L-arabinokinase
VLRYSAQPHRYVGAVPLPADVRILALDTGVRYAAGHAGWSGSEKAGMEEFRTAVAMGVCVIDAIYRDLGQLHTPLHGYLANTSPLLYRQYFRALLPRRMRAGDFVRTYGPLSELPVETEEQKARLFRLRTAVDHVISEHEHAEQFLQALEEVADADARLTPMDDTERQRTLQRAGRLLLASHHSYRLRLELSCREADWLVDRLMQAGPDRGIYGARITGAGGGGTVAVLLSRSPDATDALLEVIHAYNHLTGLVLGVTEA